MPFSIVRDNSSHCAIRFSEEDSNACFVAPEAPDGVPALIKQGHYLILIAAIWSAPDVKAIHDALKAGKAFKHRLNVGVKVFDEYTEVKGWIKDSQFSTPIWQFYTNGKLVFEQRGSYGDIISLIDKASATAHGSKI